MGKRRGTRRILRSTRFRLAAGGILVLGALALAGYLYERHRTGDVFHPHARFVAQPTPKAPPKPVETAVWPLYGYTKNHTRFFPAAGEVRPPFKQLWKRYEGGATLEFPPVIYGETIYQLPDSGVLHAINKRTGKVVWKTTLGRASASTPAVDKESVYVTLLDSGNLGEPGRVVAVNRTTGAIRWSKDLPSRSESSPLLDNGRLYFGSEDGRVYALNAFNGNVVWVYHARGAVKASPSLSNGTLYFGDYSGSVQAVSESSGRRVWISGSEGALLGSGTFYSTAAVIFGRVFLGNTDGRVYAYDARSGKLDWAVQTGAYVYSSPAVTDAPGIGPTIYIGSYDGSFRAINARTGHVDWTFDAHGRISGSPTIIGDIVYFADLGTHHIYGLGISTGRKVFELGTGTFDPAISDGEDIYLTGFQALYAFEPLAEVEAASKNRNNKGSAASSKRGKRSSAQRRRDTRKHKATTAKRARAKPSARKHSRAK